ncbi:hypothetical protein SAMN06296952_0855 [Oscillospiraceae bacterium]|nr:hypothetical protein SAMN06296952_0855 [Oscillospiraceae bacterium]
MNNVTKMLAALLSSTIVLSSCGTAADETAKATDTTTDESSVVTTSTEETADTSAEVTETAEDIRMSVEIFESDAGMPQIEADEHSIEVIDDEHSELKASVADICATYEDIYEADQIVYRLYRVDRELISFVVIVSDADIESAYTLNMRGEVLSLSDIVTDFPESCRSYIEEQVSYFVDNNYINYEPIDVDNLTDDNMLWWLDANSLVLLIDSNTYRIPFGDSFADEIVSYNGEYFACYVEGDLYVDGDMLSFYRGALTYEELSQMTLSFNGEVMDILPEEFDSTAGIANGYIYHSEGGTSYFWITHRGWYDEFFFRELIRIEPGSAQVIYMDREESECIFDPNDLIARIP